MHNPSESHRALPRITWVILATATVTLVPSGTAWALRNVGTVAEAPAMVLASVLSLGVFYVGERHWRRKSSTEHLFSELMIWGWARRVTIDRRLRRTIGLLDLEAGKHRRTSCALSPEKRLNLLRRVAADLEASDPYTHSHSRRVARYAALMAAEMGLTAEEVTRVATAAAIHDIGKLYTPRAILHKPRRLSEEEFAIIKRHPMDGARMVTLLVGDAELASIVLHHHERVDGTGYPGWLGGDRIPLAARIIAVADTFDAITCTRPYRAARPHQVALDILEREAGTQLDPDAVQAFLTVYRGRRLTTATFASLTGAFEAMLPTLGGTGALAGLAAGAAALGSLGLAASPAGHRAPIAITAAAPAAVFNVPRPHSSSRPRKPATHSGQRPATASSGPDRPVNLTKLHGPSSPARPGGASTPPGLNSASAPQAPGATNSPNGSGTPPSGVTVRTSGSGIGVSANEGGASAAVGVSANPSPTNPGAGISAGAGAAGSSAGVDVSVSQAGGLSAGGGVIPPPGP